ncbi:fibroblast growth factor-binding protein 1 [Fundulus heteroclitus]|uniref:fibroblast growth factor-binding protein 1 n=1 Tax=Fundulus heteroclitus TaxID=8078 RepID=UPI00165C29C9|nr:fibroblast growth factor-binding protein 1 [Fundulus heteroclitus]
MFPLRAFPLWLVLVLLEHRSPWAFGAKQPRIPQKIGGGKFSTRDGMRCTWSAGEAGDAVKVRVHCETSGARGHGGITETSCEYLGRPRSCAGYYSDPKAFWKQAARAFKKLQRKVCADRRALVRVGMCRRAPGEAHLRLDPNSVKKSTSAPTTPPPPLHATTAACVKRADHQRTAEEYCSSSWASVCAFLMSLVQSEDC